MDALFPWNDTGGIQCGRNAVERRKNGISHLRFEARFQKPNEQTGMEPWKIVALLCSVVFQTLAADPLKLGKIERDGAMFRAVVSVNWPPGLIPIFAVEKSGSLHWRRFPLRGQENNSEALFFGLPLEDEKPALNGRWEINATRPSGKAFLYWELTMDGTNVVGRLDPNTDYRFGTIAWGQFSSNKFAMRVEYVQDAFLLNGMLVDGRLKGDWKRTDEEESGVWEATQEPAPLPAGANLVRLFEWQNGTKRAYLIEGKSPGANWTRAERALCRVWKD
jgi:hypothetical protein